MKQSTRHSYIQIANKEDKYLQIDIKLPDILGDSDLEKSHKETRKLNDSKIKIPIHTYSPGFKTSTDETKSPVILDFMKVKGKFRPRKKLDKVKLETKPNPDLTDNLFADQSPIVKTSRN